MIGVNGCVEVGFVDASRRRGLWVMESRLQRLVVVRSTIPKGGVVALGHWPWKRVLR